MGRPALPVMRIDEESSPAGPNPALPAALHESPGPALPSRREHSVTVLDVHAPHESVHSWKGFFIHIATIVLGLFIAVAIEQTVESIHHRSESRNLQEQMRAVFETNLINDRRNLKQFATERAYLTELRAAIDARLHGQTQSPAPAAQDPRIGATMHVFPSMAPYDAAKQNGTIRHRHTGIAISAIRFVESVSVDLTAGRNRTGGKIAETSRHLTPVALTSVRSILCASVGAVSGQPAGAASMEIRSLVFILKPRLLA